MAKRKPLPIVLEPVEVKALRQGPNIRCPTGLRNRAILEIMLGAGLRVSEVCDLSPGDILWQSSLLQIRNGKGGKDRNIPINSETLGWLSSWLKSRPKSGFFFSTLEGERMSSRYLQQLVKRLGAKAGLERASEITPHTLRHTYATRMLDAGLTLRDVQVLLGHASVATTQIYTHVRPSALAAKIQGQDADPVQPLVEQFRGLPAEKIRAIGEAIIRLAGTS